MNGLREFGNLRFALTIIMVILIATHASADWTPPTIVDTVEAIPPGPRITAKGDSIAMIYGNDRFIRSLDGGLSWQDRYILPDGAHPYKWRNLKAQGDTLVLYSIFGQSDLDLAFYYSFNFGETWDGPRQCNDCNTWLGYFSAQYDGTTLSICNVIELTGQVFLINSTDFGVTWGDEIPVYNYGDITKPLLNYYYGRPYILAEYSHNLYEPTVLSLLFSTDNGVSWIHSDSIASEGANWFQSFAASSDGQMGFVYHDYNQWIGDDSWIYICLSSDSGYTWAAPNDISISDRNYFPRLAITGDTVAVAFYGYIDSTVNYTSVFVLRSFDLGQFWQSPEIITLPGENGIYPDIIMEHGKLHIAFHAGSEGVYYSRWDEESEIREKNQLPADFTLSAYPIPFNSFVTINYSNLNGGEIGIYDIQGKLITKFDLKGGENGKIKWDATDASGERVSSGIYFAKANGNDRSATIKLLYLR